MRLRVPLSELGVSVCESESGGAPAGKSNNQKGSRKIKQSKSHEYHFPIPLVFIIKTIKIPGKSREKENTALAPSSHTKLASQHIFMARTNRATGAGRGRAAGYRFSAPPARSTAHRPHHRGLSTTPRHTERAHTHTAQAHETHDSTHRARGDLNSRVH